MDDNSIMPWGIHKGKKLANVPAEYLVYLYDNNKCSGAVKSYIEENLNNLRIEINTSGKSKNQPPSKLF